jgi:hypothetical protein
MKRRVQGVGELARRDGEVPDGVYLVRVRAVRYESNRAKPFYRIEFAVLEPATSAGRAISGRLYCTSKALWKLGWFLRDFGYDPDQLDRDELDDKAVVGLRGVVKISRAVVSGRTLLNLDAFAPAAAWDGIGPSSVPSAESKRAAS